MKNKLFLLLLIIQFYSFGYQLMDSWLATPSSHTVYLTQEVYNLQASWGLNFSSCVSAVNNHGVSNVATLIAASNYSESEPCIVKFETVRNADNSVDYSSVAVCTRDSLGEYFSFTIIVNDSVFNPASHDINSVMTHELTHSLGLADNSDPTTLMYGYAGTITNLTNDEINGIKNVYEKPVIQILSPCIVSGDTLKVIYKNETDSVEFRVTTPSMLAHNSVVPPDISLAGFFTDLVNQYTGKEANFDSLGNSVYSYKTNIKVLEDYMESDIFKFRTYNKRNSWAYGNYWSNNSPSGEGLLKITPKPTNESPIPGSMYNVSPRGKGSVTDTLEIKVRVPEVLGSYPAINIKIDGVYVNPGDIVFDSTENMWIYYWDLSTANPTEYGRRYTITSEIEDDPTSNDVTGIYLVEAILFENFENFTFGEWTEWGGEWPLNSNEPWYIGNSPTISGEKSLSSTTGYTTFSNYFVLSPNVTIPDSSLNKTKLEFDIYWRYSGSLWSNLYMDICDSGGTPIVEDIFLPKSTNSWWHYNYDLSRFSGQTISIRLNNYHNFNPNYVIFTRYDIDNFLIYAIPDMDSPNIDFVSGNFADLNEDMNLTLQFNDNSGIGSVTADYSIEEDSNTITLYPVKGTYNYTGFIPARDHECIGTISFRIKDSVGNETVSSGHSIGWAIGGGGLLTAPQNVVLAQPTSTTIAITWDLVDGATSYKVYSSTDPYGTFTEDSTGTFTETRKWEKTIADNKYFYYVIAVNATKFDVEVIKEEEFEIAKAGENK
jgi:hypothetical protein